MPPAPAPRRLPAPTDLDLDAAWTVAAAIDVVRTGSDRRIATAPPLLRPALQLLRLALAATGPAARALRDLDTAGVLLAPSLAAVERASPAGRRAAATVRAALAARRGHLAARAARAAPPC